MSNVITEMPLKGCSGEKVVLIDTSWHTENVGSLLIGLFGLL